MPRPMPNPRPRPGGGLRPDPAAPSRIAMIRAAQAPHARDFAISTATLIGGRTAHLIRTGTPMVERASWYRTLMEIRSAGE